MSFSANGISVRAECVCSPLRRPLRVRSPRAIARAPRVRVTPSKRRGDALPVTEALHHQATPWAQLLCNAAHPNSLVPFCTLPPAELNSWLRSRLRGTRDADASWHGFRRGCATYMWHRGHSISAIQQAGRWQSATVARMYIYAWID